MVNITFENEGWESKMNNQLLQASLNRPTAEKIDSSNLPKQFRAISLDSKGSDHIRMMDMPLAIATVNGIGMQQPECEKCSSNRLVADTKDNLI